MLERLLRFAAIACSLIIAISFAMFAVDESKSGSRHQVNELSSYTQPAPSAAGEQAREQRDSAVREHIDDADDVLLKPFAGLVTSGGAILERGVPTVLGLLVYGFGLGYLARFMRGRGSAPALGYKPRRT
ncbi:MAG TPA: hypothetical protein VGF63_04795 [Solirubrobacteraceae bacterium]